MRIRPLVVTLALFAMGTWASDHALAAAELRPEELARGAAVQVTVGTSAPEAWKGATVTARFTVMQSASGNTPRPAGSRVSLRGMVNGATASTFDTDLAPGVTRIVLDPIVFELTESATGPMRMPSTTGGLKPPEVAFTFASGSKAMADWVKTTTPARRDVNVMIKNAQGVAQRTITLLRSLPVTYTSAGSVSVISIRPETIQVKATGSHVSVFEWMGGNLTGNFAPRDVKLSFTDGMGRELSTTLLKGALLTEVAWSPLDKSSLDTVTESIVVLPAQIDPMP